MTALPPPMPPATPPPAHEPPAARESWVERPWAARAVGVVAYLIPLLASIAAAFALSSVIPHAASFPVAVVRWLAIAVVSTVVLVAVERQTRRLLPLRTLLGLTLAFPDRAPSRFKIAIRTGTTNQLRQRLAEARDGRLGDTPSEAAERLLELVGMLSQHDRITRGHSERVRAYSHLIGQEMGLGEEELDRLRWAGLLHDVGKLAISTEILNKPDKLTAEEYEIIKTHPMEGKVLVEPLADWLGESANAVWEHHERFDGNGYPQGLAGSSISQAARIVSVADVFDVMTSVRSYTAALSSTAARKELADCAGTQFDPDVVKAFLAVSMGRVRVAMGPLSWLAQLSMFPAAVVGQTGPALATTAAVAAGSAAGAVGIVASPTEPWVHVEPEYVTTIDEDVEDGLGAPVTTLISVTDDSTGAQIQVLAADDPSVAPDRDPAVPDDGPVESVPEVLPTPTSSTTSTTSTPSATTTDIPAPLPTAPLAPVATTSTTTTTTTTTTTVPPVDGPLWIYLASTGTGDTESEPVLALSAAEPSVSTLFNYDTDRDDAPGLLIKKDAEGIDGTDATKRQAFVQPFAAPTRLAGDMRVSLYVAADDFQPDEVHVEALVEVCTASGECSPIGRESRKISNARRFKRANLNFGAVDVSIEAGGLLRVTVAATDASETDMLLAFGTSEYDASFFIG